MNKLLYLAAGLSLTACQRAEDPAPTGANTFTCQIDGQSFSPYLAPIILIPQQALEAGRDGKGRFAITARTSLEKVSFVLVGVHGPGTYPLGSGGPYWQAPRRSYGVHTYAARRLSDGTEQPERNAYTDSLAVGTVQITRYDTVANVAGGTFQYTAREAATGRLLRITDGKFDVRL